MSLATPSVRRQKIHAAWAVHGRMRKGDETMPINTIRNSTGGVLKLWDGGNLLAEIQEGGAVHNVPITITGVTLDGEPYERRENNFVNDASYDARSREGLPPIIEFVNGTTVTFILA
jgi:hypothetical protein